MGEKYLQESDLRIWMKNQEFGPGSGSIELFLLGGCQTPCSSWGASSPPDPLAGGLQPPAPPRRFLRGSASQALRFFGTKALIKFNAQVRQVRRFEPEPPNLLFFKTGSNLWTAMHPAIKYVAMSPCCDLKLGRNLACHLVIHEELI